MFGQKFEEFKEEDIEKPLKAAPKKQIKDEDEKYSMEGSVNLSDEEN